MTLGATTIIVGLTLMYTIRLVLLSRHRRRPLLRAPDRLLFVFLIPCLNEERVIAKSLERLEALPSRNRRVLVIDDGSDDATADIVRSFGSDGVDIFQRTAPNARQGKGEALNAAYRYLCDSPLLAGWDPSDVVVAVLDADGRLAPNALVEVAPFFGDPKVGGVQIGVRMYNANESLLARMQDVEFVTFTEIFQRARQKLGCAGLGGNGQFTRLTALQSLGPAPWTHRLTEDLDLGIQILLHGWTNTFCPTTHVSQQAVLEFRRLVRQRARWFQGHLQCWMRIPEIVSSNLRLTVVIDLLFHLLSASLVLIMTVPSALFVILMTILFVSEPTNTLRMATSHHGMFLVLGYLLSFGLAPAYGMAYWLRDREISLTKSLLYAHAFSVYSYMWVPAGWRALWRTVKRKGDWAKTARSIDPVVEAA